MVIENAVEDQVRNETWMEAEVRFNPDRIFLFDPLDETELVIDPKNNSRGYTPEIGHKSLASLMDSIIADGQTSPCFATLGEDGRAYLYAGFRRARAVQNILPPIKLKVIITPTVLTEQAIFERSLSENVQRLDMTVMQRVDALVHLTETFELSIAQAAEKMNVSKALASTYIRFALFPPVAKKAINDGKIGYKAAEALVALLPKRHELRAELELASVSDPGTVPPIGTLLAKAHVKIAKIVEKELAKAAKKSDPKVDNDTDAGEAVITEDENGVAEPIITLPKSAKLLATINNYVNQYPEHVTRFQLEAFAGYIAGTLSIKKLVKSLTKTMKMVAHPIIAFEPEVEEVVEDIEENLSIEVESV